MRDPRKLDPRHPRRARGIWARYTRLVLDALPLHQIPKARADYIDLRMILRPRQAFPPLGPFEERPLSQDELAQILLARLARGRRERRQS